MKKNDSGDKIRDKQSGRRSATAKSADVALTLGPTDSARSKRQGCPIVGVGASAGGLQALTQLFENIPLTTGMAFVVIQHLDATHASALVDILSKVTLMPVGEAKDNTPVLPDQVYVIAPGTGVTIAGGTLIVAPKGEGRRRFTLIDAFLESLAQDKVDKSIGVILSGTGSDGSQGIKEIKTVGGITFTQEPSSAEYDGMPLSAIATGMVDFILPPGKIAGELAKISQSHIFTSPMAAASELFPDGADAMGRIIGLLRKASGINFADYKQLTVKRRIMRRMVLHKIDKLDDYVVYLRQNSTELAVLQQDMLINVTSFFREPQGFETLKKVVFPTIVNNTAASAPIRLWVPGCATGEEAYSLAIALREFLADHTLDRPIQIFATDINETVIGKARVGIYPKSIAADVSPARLSRFFVEVEQGYRVSETIRELCLFARHDIAKDPPISKVDLISCRNVMIYLGPALHKRIFPVFHYALNPGGFLVLGASESIGAFADLFALVDKKYRIYAKKAVATPLMFEYSAAEHAASLPKPFPKDDSGPVKGGSLLDVQKEADRIIVSKYGPPGVIINSKLDIIQFRGRTGLYLEPASGMPSVNLLKMARDGLFLELRAAISEAQKKNVLVRKEGLRIVRNGNFLVINVNVVPINGPFQKGEYFLVLFREAKSPQMLDRNPDTDAAVGEPDDVLRMKQEMATTREYLQSMLDQHQAVNEDLSYANEEIQSSNEELQSMNEEMETAREELQSTNEELMTLNEELGNRNQELSHVNNDLLNVLRGINIPVLILNSDLRIRRFNSMAEKLLNLIGTDVGRPINNIKPNIDIFDLEQWCLEVIDTLNSKEQEVQDRWGHWYSMQIRPYKTAKNKIDGVIIVFADIDPIKNHLQAVQEVRIYAEAIVETIRQPLLVLDADLRLKTANRAFYQTFRMKPEEETNQSIFQMWDGLWDIPQLHSLLHDIVEDNASFEDFAFSYDFPDIGWKEMLINARPVVNPNSKAKLILLAFEPVDSQAGKP